MKTNLLAKFRCYTSKLFLILCVCATTIHNRDFSEEDLTHYRDRVVHMFQHAYNGYLKYAYPYDELRPLTCDGHDTWGSYSLTLVDALDTLAIMGNNTEFQRVAKLLENSLNFDKDINVSVFETNIRVVGGLVSAHLLSKRAGAELESGWPCTGPLLRLAEKVARKLLPAFNTSTGMPYGTVNLLHGVPEGETTVTCTAGVGTFLVEFGTLTKLTGDPVFLRVASRAMKALWDAKSPIGLLGNHINVDTGKWTALDSGIGAGVDSYFEYLVKGAILFQNPELMDRFQEHVLAIEQYLKREDWYMWAHMTKGTITLPVFQSLEAFWPGLQSLVGDVDKGMRTLHNYHQVWRQFGFVPEFYNIPKFETQGNREGYPLRPELIESVMYLYQATRDPYLLEVGVDMLESIEHSARTRCGYATVKDVRDHRLENRMESFFLAETTKYLYLLFDTDNFIHNSGGQGTVIQTPNGECIIDAGGYVFNTEAHPVDGAALYCCSAEKKEDDLLVQKLHENVDLLSLLNLADSSNGAFSKNIDNPYTKKPHIRLKNNPVLGYQHLGPPVFPNVGGINYQGVFVHTPQQEAKQPSENEKDTSSESQNKDSTTANDSSESGSSQTKAEVSKTERQTNTELLQKLGEALKGTKVENLDAAVGDIIKLFNTKVAAAKVSKENSETAGEAAAATADTNMNLEPPGVTVESGDNKPEQTGDVLNTNADVNVPQDVTNSPSTLAQDIRGLLGTLAQHLAGSPGISAQEKIPATSAQEELPATSVQEELPGTSAQEEPQEANDAKADAGDAEREGEAEAREEVCTAEEEAELWQRDPSEAARQMLLLTCPARSFSARYSVRGEFSPVL